MHINVQLIEETLECRSGCAACCIAPSISSAMPLMPFGKPAGVACLHLTEDKRCDLFGLVTRPVVCGSLQPSASMCGSSTLQALTYLTQLEQLTCPTTSN